MGHDVRLVLVRRRHKVLDDDRPGQRRDQRIAVHVQRVSLQGRQAVVVGELVADVGDLGLHRTAGQRPLADDLHVLATLADVNGQGDHFGPGGLLDPPDGHRCVQTAAEGEHHSV